MFSFFRKKEKKPEKPSYPPSPPPGPLSARNRYIKEYMENTKKYEADAADAREFFGADHPKTKAEMIDLLVALRLGANEFASATKRLEEEKKQEQQEAEAFRKAYQLEQQAEEERIRQKNRERNERLNHLAHKYSYKSRKNFLNNAATQRSAWRSRNPRANYMSIENFADSPFFQPHYKYTGITNNNASTITLNSPRSIRSNRPYSPFGGNRKTRRRLKH